MSVLADIVRDTINSIKRSHHVLTTETDLSPENDKITNSLTDLVRMLAGGCQYSKMAQYLLDTPLLAEERKELPGLCGKAECAMEKYWARKLIAQNFCDLQQFWYMAEYNELCRAELELINGRVFDRVTFLGSGALPLTAIILAQNCPQSKILCVDYDAEAIELSSQLIRRVGLSHRIEVMSIDAKQYIPGKNELVICASLLQGGEEIYNRLKERSDCALIVRDAEGIYQFLYKPALLPSNDFKEISKTEIHSKRINTSRYYQAAQMVLEPA